MMRRKGRQAGRQPWLLQHWVQVWHLSAKLCMPAKRRGTARQGATRPPTRTALLHVTPKEDPVSLREARRVRAAGRWAGGRVPCPEGDWRHDCRRVGVRLAWLVAGGGLRRVCGGYERTGQDRCATPYTDVSLSSRRTNDAWPGSSAASRT